MDKILYVKVVDRNIVVRTENDRHEGSLTNQLESILEHYGFARLNQNVMVNLDMITSFDPELGIVYFSDDQTLNVQVSRRNRHKVPSDLDG